MSGMDRSGSNRAKWIEIEDNRPKWSEMYGIDQNGQNGAKWIKIDQMDRS